MYPGRHETVLNRTADAEKEGDTMKKIKEALPYKHCKNCPYSVLSVKEQGVVIDGIRQTAIVVKCRRENNCKMEEKNNG